MVEDPRILRTKYKMAKSKFRVGDRVSFSPEEVKQLEGPITGTVTQCGQYFMLIKADKGGTCYTYLYVDIMIGHGHIRMVSEATRKLVA